MSGEERRWAQIMISSPGGDGEGDCRITDTTIEAGVELRWRQ